MDTRSSRPGFLLAVLVICAAFPVLSHIAWMFMPSGEVTIEQAEFLHIFSMGMDGLQSVLTLTAVIAFMVFIYGVFKGMRAAGRQTKYSPGLAVGSWFIPFANLVMPALAVAEAYRLRTGRSAGIVALWWIGYLLVTGLRVGFQGLESSGMGFDPELQTIFIAAGWGLTILTVGTFALWASIVSSISKPNVG